MVVGVVDWLFQKRRPAAASFWIAQANVRAAQQIRAVRILTVYSSSLRSGNHTLSISLQTRPRENSSFAFVRTNPSIAVVGSDCTESSAPGRFHFNDCR